MVLGPLQITGGVLQQRVDAREPIPRSLGRLAGLQQPRTVEVFHASRDVPKGHPRVLRFKVPQGAFQVELAGLVIELSEEGSAGFCAQPVGFLAVRGVEASDELAAALVGGLQSEGDHHADLVHTSAEK